MTETGNKNKLFWVVIVAIVVIILGVPYIISHADEGFMRQRTQTNAAPLAETVPNSGPPGFCSSACSDSGAFKVLIPRAPIESHNDIRTTVYTPVQAADNYIHYPADLIESFAADKYSSVSPEYALGQSIKMSNADVVYAPIKDGVYPTDSRHLYSSAQEIIDSVGQGKIIYHEPDTPLVDENGSVPVGGLSRVSPNITRRVKGDYRSQMKAIVANPHYSHHNSAGVHMPPDRTVMTGTAGYMTAGESDDWKSFIAKNISHESSRTVPLFDKVQ